MIFFPSFLKTSPRNFLPTNYVSKCSGNKTKCISATKRKLESDLVKIWLVSNFQGRSPAGCTARQPPASFPFSPPWLMHIWAQSICHRVPSVRFLSIFSSRQKWQPLFLQVLTAITHQLPFTQNRVKACKCFPGFRSGGRGNQSYSKRT